MIFLPKNRQKRNQLFLTLAAVILLLAGIGFGVIRPQYLKLSTVKKNTADAQTQLQSYVRVIHQSEASATELASLTRELSKNEQDMANGDIYAWTIDTMRHFKMNYRVDVPDIGQPIAAPMDLLPLFPYSQLKFTLRGTGYYHDIGRFIADLENKYPHMRVINLDMVPIGGDSEKLSFSMDIVALVKSSS